MEAELALDLPRLPNARRKGVRPRPVVADRPICADLIDLIDRAPPAVATAPPALAVTALPDEGESFGEWLLAQETRAGWLGALAKGAKADRLFPRRGSPDEVRIRLRAIIAGGDVFEAVDDAERNWLRRAA